MVRCYEGFVLRADHGHGPAIVVRQDEIGCLAGGQEASDAEKAESVGKHLDCAYGSQCGKAFVQTWCSYRMTRREDDMLSKNPALEEARCTQGASHVREEAKQRWMVFLGHIRSMIASHTVIAHVEWHI